jgi:peptidoglycan/LPS O-acetylase OafA/YrhL
MSAFLDVMSIVTNVVYIGFMIAALRQQLRRTVAALIKACQHYWTAAALATLVLVINIADAPTDGWASPAVNLFTLVMCVVCAVSANRQRDRLVIAEMQRDLGRES